MALAKNAKLIYALRFLIGVAEASSYPGIITVLYSWYTPQELAKRVAIFGTSYPAANIFVSFMQAALHQGMNGTHGLSGWRWLFIFNAIMTAIVAVTGFLFVPDSPADCRVPWLTPVQRDIARQRMDRIGRASPVGWSICMLKKTFTTWPLYIFAVAYATWTWSQNSNTWILIPFPRIRIGGYILMIVAMLFFSWLSDWTQKRCRWVVVQQSTMLFGCIILSAWPSSFVFKMFAYFVLWLSNAAGPILVAWMADICNNSAEQRALILGVTLTLVFAIDSFANIFIYPASEAPHYYVGYKAAAGFAGGSIIFTLLMKRMHLRELARRGDVEAPISEDVSPKTT